MSFNSLFAGKMLGDGYLNKSHNAPRFAFIHSLSDLKYVEYCYQKFSQYIPFGKSALKQEAVFDKRTGKIYYRVFCQSKTSTELRKLYSIWYSYGRKTIPVEWLDQHFNEESLAIWFQDDGSLRNDGDRIILSTESFSEEERSYLQILLHKKYLIHSNLDCQGRLDISSRKEVRKFQAITENYIHSSMIRKSIKHKWEKWNKDWHKEYNIESVCFRTSVYLTYKLYDKIRGIGYTKLINDILSKWIDDIWDNYMLIPQKRYLWLIKNENVEKGKFLITPRFKPDIKAKLEIFLELQALIYQTLW